MPTSEQLAERIDAIEHRNAKVALDKRWERSITRRVLLMLFTYTSVSLYFLAIDVPSPFVNAVVPTLGFLLSTLTLPWFKSAWQKFHR